MDDHEYGVMRTNTFLSQVVSVHHSVCALCRRKSDVRGVYVYTPVGYSGSPSVVNETNCNKKEKDLGHFILFKNYNHELHQLLDVSQFHQESIA